MLIASCFANKATTTNNILAYYYYANCNNKSY